MSFITKRERVFNEYELFDLPSRNEGKLKAYASCVDTRAWSHFCSDKAEHLVDIIKRNNEMCRTKYVPTHVIVDTIMSGKNAEIGRLKRRIEEFEQLLAAYDNLELTCDQKCEIAKAHSAIREANKELDELCLRLDLSAFTEAIDSEAFATGKSRGDETAKSKGDEWSYDPERDSKGIQAGLECPCDVSTLAIDPRIGELAEVIVTKDAKLNAMQNTIAVLGNEVCEPYCIYAHIYTALEKIFGILCQNQKYKLYLDLMISGKDTQCLDIKGKILIKMKVLEKFSLALVAPCSTELTTEGEECACYRAEVSNQIESLASVESSRPGLDSKRAQLVADIMQNDEMKEILDKHSIYSKSDETNDVIIDDYNIDAVNLKRLKSLQGNFDDLVACYETLKHEKDCLQIKCRKYEDLEIEFGKLQIQVREYNALWNEKEHYKNRSADLDELKEQFLILSEETSSIELQLKSETEINEVKSKTIEELRKDNISMEKKLNDALISYEREKNTLQCKLKECECKEMCQDQQIKVLSVQIDRLLEQDSGKVHEQTDLDLNDKINSQKEQINNLKELLYGSEEEKQQLESEYQTKLDVINDLKMEIEEWKSTYEKTLQRNEYLEKYSQNFSDEIQRLLENNQVLERDLEEKSNAIDNLIGVIKSKSLEINTLMENIEQKDRENSEIQTKVQRLSDAYQKHISSIDSEKSEALTSLGVARQESQELLEKVKKYSDLVHKQEILSNSYQKQYEECEEMKSLLNSVQEDNKKMQMQLANSENQNAILIQQIKRLQDITSHAASNINSLNEEKQQYRQSLELTKKESKILEQKLQDYEDLTCQLQELRDAHDKLVQEKGRLVNELHDRTIDLDNAVQSYRISQNQSEELLTKLHQSESTKSELFNLSENYKALIAEKESLQNELDEKKNDFEKLLKSFNELKFELEKQNERKSIETDNLKRSLTALKNAYDELLAERVHLQNNLQNRNKEIDHLRDILETKSEENDNLREQVKSLEYGHKTIVDDMDSLKREHFTTSSTLDALKKDSNELLNKVKYYESLENDYHRLKRAHDKLIEDKGKLQRELETQVATLRKTQHENSLLSQNLLSHSEDLENALINARTQLAEKSSSSENPYTDVWKEIEAMKSEKVNNQTKLKTLLDKLDRAENIISNLNEEILARDDKISNLENHINALKAEVNELHRTLSSVIDTGEELSVNSNKKISNALQSMEAHHSKATHNMKMEMAKLQKQKVLLEEQLSRTELKKNESDHEKLKYISQIANLQNEREIIVTDIKQLELKSVGDSPLSPNKCNTEDILNSLERIGKILDARNNKSTSLEQTLLQVKDSYQLVQSKTDEAKRIVEKEKQKIISEKEEAIKDRINMEKELIHLKQQLNNQINQDKARIEDLEGELSNQMLIIKMMNESSQKTCINKLEEELNSLRSLYENSVKKVTELENRLKSALEDSSQKMEILEQANKNLLAKCKEIDYLRQKLNSLKKPITHDIATQVFIPSATSPTYTQTETEIQPVKSKQENEKYNKLDDNNDIKLINLNNIYKSKRDNNGDLPTQNDILPGVVNEVQILTANVDPSLDYVKNVYLNYKLKQLSTSNIIQHSFSANDNSNLESAKQTHRNSSYPTDSINLDPKPTTSKVHSLNFIDLYNKDQSLNTDSSKDLDNFEKKNENENIKNKPTSSYTKYSLNEEINEIENKNQYADEHSYQTPSVKSTNKDLFVIYKDSETNYVENPEKKNWVRRNSEILVEAVTFQPNQHDQRYEPKQNSDIRKYSRTKERISEPLIYIEDVEDDDSVKPKLNINMPRIDVDTHSLDNSDTDKKSLGSFTVASKEFYSSNFKIDEGNIEHDKVGQSYSAQSLSNGEEQFYDSYNSTDEHKINQHLSKKGTYTIDYGNEDSNNIVPASAKQASYIKIKEDSHHKLSRVGADVLLVRTESIQNRTSPEQVNHINYGLDYILDSTQHQDDPNNLKTYNAAKKLRKTRSYDQFSLLKDQTLSDSNPVTINDPKKHSALYYKTELSSNSPSKATYRSEPKTYVDKSIMVKLDRVEEYEKKINNLTRALENIEKDYKKKIDAIKSQYDNNIKSIINEHNQGVKSIQNLHEETLQDIIKIHENEVENLRTMSIEAMRKAEKLEKENKTLKIKIKCSNQTSLDEEPIKMSTPDFKRHRKLKTDSKMLTKTNIEAFNVKPKSKYQGPCTCTIDINISDTIRNLFEQVDVEQRKKAEHNFLKTIANKMIGGNVEALDTHELSFLHLKVCHIWKTKLSKEETLQKRIDSLESELFSKQRLTQRNIAELDRKVAEERRRLQEVREAVCRFTPTPTINTSKNDDEGCSSISPVPTIEKEFLNRCNCSAGILKVDIGERRSAGDLAQFSNAGLRPKRTRNESNRAVSANLDCEERREKKLHPDELPTRLRKIYERQPHRPAKK